MTPTISSGTRFSVSQSLPVAFTKAGFESLIFTRVRAVRSLGDIGKQYRLAMSDPIDGVPSQRRAGLEAQSLPIEMISIGDQGQALLKAGIDSRRAFSYRIQQPNGIVSYFTAISSSRLCGIGQASDIADTKLVLQINSPLIEG